MLKNTITSLLFIVLNFIAFAQLQPNTIQVLVEEHVDLNVKEYVYHISDSDISGNSAFDFGMRDYYDDEDEYYDEDEEEIGIAPKLLTIPEMKSKLEASKFTSTVLPNGRYNIDPDDDNKIKQIDKMMIEVRVASIDELKRLCKLVVKMDGAYGELVDISYEDISTYHATIFPKMMNKATDKANFIAAASGKKVGEVIQVSEGLGSVSLYGDELGDYMDQMMELSSKLWSKSIPQTKSERIELTYVFELN